MFSAESLILQEVTLPQWGIAALVSAAVVLFGTFLTKFGKHSEVTISGPVEIRVLQEADKRIEGSMTKGFADLKSMFEVSEIRMDKWKAEVLDKLGKMSLNQERLGWRLDSVERELQDIRDKRIATLENELKGLGSTKERIASIEKELKQLNGNKKEGEAK